MCVLSTKIADGFLVELQDNDDDDDKESFSSVFISFLFLLFYDSFNNCKQNVYIFTPLYFHLF